MNLQGQKFVHFYSTVLLWNFLFAGWGSWFCSDNLWQYFDFRYFLSFAYLICLAHISAMKFTLCIMLVLFAIFHSIFWYFLLSLLSVFPCFQSALISHFPFESTQLISIIISFFMIALCTSLPPSTFIFLFCLKNLPHSEYLYICSSALPVRQNVTYWLLIVSHFQLE